MKLRFAEVRMADKFEDLVKRHGYTPSRFEEKGWIVIESAIDGTAKRKLMSEWVFISMEDHTKPTTPDLQRKLL